MLSRYTVFFVACALPLLFAHQIAPSMAHELDFWLLWVIAMLVVGLPVLFAEFALSARSGDGVWLGMQKLTREADAKMTWRVFAGLSVLVSLLISATMTARIGTGLHQHLPQFDLGVPSIGLSAGVMVVALILSLLKTRLLGAGVIVVVIGGLISLFDGGLSGGVSVPIITSVSLGEWARAVSLALLSVGVGTGLYWFLSVEMTRQVMGQHNKKPLSGLILPIWLTQLIFGAFALLVGSAFVTPTSFAVTGVGMLFITSFLLYYAIGELKIRLGFIKGISTGIVLAMLLSALPANITLIMLVFISLLTVIILAIFSGFIMKISHLRKTFNFKSEGRYNVWRVLMRIGVPLAIIIALIGWVGQWLQ